MKYRVIGTDSKTKASVELILDAADEAAARADSAARGIAVERVVPADDPRTPRIQLIELTAKKWKGLFLFSAATLLAGAMLGGWLLLRTPQSLAHPPIGAWIGGAIALLGLAGVVAARLGAWWHHG